MSKLLTLFLAFILCQSAFAQCASQASVPSSAFNGKKLATNGSCLSYRLTQPVVRGLAYQIKIGISQVTPNNCTTESYTIAACDIQCLIYLGHYSCDNISSVPDTIRNDWYPFFDSLTNYTCQFTPSDTFSYISLKYNYCFGGLWVGCPDSLIIDSVSLSALPASIQLISNPCIGDSSGKAIVHSVGYPPFTYQWNNGTTDSVLSNVSAGTYEVTVTDSVGCVTYDTVNIHGRALPMDTIVKSGGFLLASPASLYQWYLNGNVIAGATSQSYVPIENGYYYVEVIDSGCASSPSDTIDITNIVGGVNEVTSIGVRLYPNPATNTVTIYSDNLPMSLKLCDLTGRVIISQELSSNMNNLDVNQIARGMYLVKIQQGEKQFCQKLIIQ